MRKIVHTSVLVLLTVLLGACVAPPTVPSATAMINPGDKIGDFLVTTGQAGEIVYAWEQNCTQQGSAEEYVCPLTSDEKVNPTTGVFPELGGVTLDSVWSDFAYELWIDGRPVNLTAFGSVDVPHHKAGTIRFWNVVLEAVKPGEIVVHDKGKVNDKAFESTSTYTFTAP